MNNYYDSGAHVWVLGYPICGGSVAEWLGHCTSNTVISSLFLTELDLFRVVPGLTPHLAPVVQTLDSAIPG